MKLDTLALTLFCVVVGGVITFWVSMLVLAALSVPLAWVALLPAALVGYLIWRVIAQRVGNPEDDHYDRMDH